MIVMNTMMFSPHNGSYNTDANENLSELKKIMKTITTSEPVKPKETFSQEWKGTKSNANGGSVWLQSKAKRPKKIKTFAI
jgi:hypothetical protein